MTTDHPILGQVALGYAPMIDRHRAVTALRLTVFPAQPGAAPDGNALLALLAQAWPAEAGRLSLNIANEALLGQVLRAAVPPHMMVEVPTFIAAEADHAAALQALHRQGNTLLIKGLPGLPLAPELLPCFGYSLIDLADERRDGLPPPGGATRTIPHVQSGVTTLAEMTEAFARGAYAVVGWPIDDIPVPPAGQARPVKTSIAPLVELINRVDKQEAIDRLEAVVKTDPTLAYRMLKYINSPLFGLRVEITSFGHAIMMLGYQRLKRWLALMLVSGTGEPGLRPLAFAAVRRGLLMEELGRDGGADDALRGELFVCGVFSLLDRMLQQPFATLLASIPTSPAVRDALERDEGPFMPYLNLVRALEASSIFDIRDAADALMMAQPEVNAALLRALVAARQLD